MNKEVKIGMAVLLVLLIGLGAAIVYRMRGGRKPPPAEIKAPAEAAAEQTKKILRSGPEPTVLEPAPATMDPPGVQTASRPQWQGRAVDEPQAPRTSFMPKALPDGDRYSVSAYPDESYSEVPDAAPSLDHEEEVPESALPQSEELPEAETDAEDSQPSGQVTTRFVPSQGPVGEAEEFEEQAPAPLPEASHLASPARRNEPTFDPGAPAALNAEPPAQLTQYSQQATNHSPPPAASDYRSDYPVPSSPAPSGNFSPAGSRLDSAVQQPQRAAPVKRENTGTYQVEPGDSFWSISQKIYGQGGYFKALIEHNRARFPVPSRLKIGDEVLTPTEGELRAKYSGLCPKERGGIAAEARVVPVARRAAAGSRTYLVEEGDTLFDIARYELGEARRWPEIYQLNRQVLGDDINYLRPGLELVLPEGRQGDEDVLTSQPREAIRR